MEKLIFIKYGELNTKKGNINFFLTMLKKNISEALKDMNVQIKFDKGRMFIESDNIDEVGNRLDKIFGIYSYVYAYKIDKDFDNIKDKVLTLIKDDNFNTFKVETKRSDKTYPLDSMEVSKKIGGHILRNIDKVNVDVHNPELIINIEIRHDYAYIYTREIKGLGGYPVGCTGKSLLMLSGGIDSPVAGFLSIKRGIKLECIYFAAPPHTSQDAEDKVLALAKKLSIYNGDIKVHVVNITEIEEAIYRHLPREYMITILRRMMYRITERLAKKIKAKVIVNGESIGQVASQTLDSMNVINNVISMPVIRPVACLDKLEIIDIAKKINTYETSILPYEDCCTIFVPDHPVINPKLNECIEMEKLIPYEDMINDCLNKVKTIKVCNKEEKYQDIL